MIEYKYKKRENKFTENGHTMFEFDVLQRLKRLAYLEEQMKQGQLLPIDSVVGQSEQFECDVCYQPTNNIKDDEGKRYCDSCEEL